MDDYVEKMIKDKFLLDIITTAFYEYGKPVEVMHPDLKHQFDLVLSCNEFYRLIRIKYKSLKKTSKLEFIGFDESSISLMKSLSVEKKEIIDITLEVELNGLSYKIKYKSKEKSIEELLKILFKLEDHKSPLTVSETYKFEKSTFSEQFGTYSFIRNLRETLWLKFNKTKITILRGEVDAFGYDLVLSFKGIVRYVQLKLSNSSVQHVNIALADKKGACVVWQREDEKEKAWKEKLKYGYHFLGGKPKESLDFLWLCKVQKSSKQEGKEEIKGKENEIKELKKKRNELPTADPKNDEIKNIIEMLNKKICILKNNRKTKFKKSKREVRFSYLCDLSKSCKLEPIAEKLLHSLKNMIDGEVKNQAVKAEENRTNVSDFYKYEQVKNIPIYQNIDNNKIPPMINLISILFDIYPTGTN